MFKIIEKKCKSDHENVIESYKTIGRNSVIVIQLHSHIVRVRKLPVRQRLGNYVRNYVQCNP